MGETPYMKSTLIEYFNENGISFVNFDPRKIIEKTGNMGGVEYAVVELKLSNDTVFSSENPSAINLIIKEPYRSRIWSDGTGGVYIDGSFKLEDYNKHIVFESNFNNSAELKSVLENAFPDKTLLEEKRKLESIKKEINHYTIESINDYVCDLQASIRILWKLIQQKYISGEIKFKSLITEYLSTLFTKVYELIIGCMPNIVKNATNEENSIPEEEKAVQILKSEIGSILVRLKEIKVNIGNEPDKTKLSLICGELENLREKSDW